jgi:hypothetical protein
MGVTAFCSSRTFCTILRHPKISSFRRIWRSSQKSPFYLHVLAGATLQAQFQFRFYSGVATPSSLPTDAMNTDERRAHPSEIRGQSGRQYKIERVLQDKGNLLGRVFLAT